MQRRMGRSFIYKRLGLLGYNNLPSITILMNMRRNVPLFPTADQVASLLSAFRIDLSADQLAKIQEYIRLLLKWNQRVSLTSIIDPLEIVSRHFGESLFVCSLLSVENCRLADLGSGAGFPGLALKIARPGLQLTMIESNRKKCTFLSEIVRSLGLKYVEILPMRFDDIRAAADFEIITARAIGGFPGILRWTETALTRRGHLILWLGGEDTTKISSTRGWIWQPAIKIPDSQRRFVLIGRPRSEGSLLDAR
jgi:16S rRNA (guanine527-N7)-methyltransferase